MKISIVGYPLKFKNYEAMRELKPNSIAIVGGGGCALEVTSFLVGQDMFCDYELVGYIAPTESAKLSIPYLGNDENLSQLKTHGLKNLAVCLGDNSLRSEFVCNTSSSGFLFPHLVHRSSYIAADIKIPKGTIVYPNVTLNAGVQVGEFCLFNSNSSVGHETQIADFVTLAPGASVAGNVRIGGYSYIGIGSSVREKVTISTNVLVGAGAAVVSDLNSAGTYVGVPAKKRE